MAWVVLSADEVLEELSPAEVTTLKGIQGATDMVPALVTRAIAECRGAIAAGNYPVDSIAGTIPDGLKSDVIALARWRWLIAFPQLKALQTSERKDAYNDARKKLEAISNQDFA